MTLLSEVTEICSETNEPQNTTDSLEDASFLFLFFFYFSKSKRSETDKSFARCHGKPQIVGDGLWMAESAIMKLEGPRT